VRRHLPYLAALLPLWLCGCAAIADVAPTKGFANIPAEEAAWRQVEPRLVGMSRIWVENCAGPPLSEVDPTPQQTTLIYRSQDLKNYCQVALGIINGRISSVSADYSAPEYAWLRSGTNYCGRIFMGCAR
jgi:hypothetical protein